ncbi:putative methyltransferase C9orf114 [Anopheles ziemanni]|uniref:putative methyltransferase C9orf114 n=1 Tax=Anopheles coustani TaxID=139045 RepID=UPI00265973D4|nr:putative methyltransferase C9orf114 [Anopheles coustani]XP_058178816.1 putative methyltransferase C9orf114 [Anopheles ziemanni]
MKVNQKKRLKEREKMELKEIKRQKRQQNLLNRVKEQFEEIEQEKQAALDDVPVPVVSEDQRVSTVSIAVPGSIMENAQSPELRTYLAGQIARAACVFQVDEVIVFDDCAPHNQGTDRMASIETSEGATSARRCCIQLARILQYLECPQYLRKYFFPIHNDLKYCGLLNPLDSQHHLRQLSEFVFREGIVTNKPVKMGKGSFVNVGLLNDVRVDDVLEPNVRVTVKLPEGAELKSRKLRAKVVPPSQPRQETGIYWGYTVRIANSLSQVFTKSPYKGGYDLTIGTSDRGTNVHELEAKSLSYRHALVVFGGVLGLEPALESDTKLTVDSVEDLFDEYLNTVPGQGSRTVRTEEAILISMAALGGKLHPVNAPKPFACFDAIPQSKDTGIQQYAFNDVRTKPKKTPKTSVPDALPVVNVVDDYMSRFD